MLVLILEIDDLEGGLRPFRGWTLLIMSRERSKIKIKINK